MACFGGSRARFQRLHGETGHGGPSPRQPPSTLQSKTAGPWNLPHPWPACAPGTGIGEWWVYPPNLKPAVRAPSTAIPPTKNRILVRQGSSGVLFAICWKARHRAEGGHFKSLLYLGIAVECRFACLVSSSPQLVYRTRGKDSFPPRESFLAESQIALVSIYYTMVGEKRARVARENNFSARAAPPRA